MAKTYLSGILSGLPAQYITAPFASELDAVIQHAKNNGILEKISIIIKTVRVPQVTLDDYVGIDDTKLQVLIPGTSVDRPYFCKEYVGVDKEAVTLLDAIKYFKDEPQYIFGDVVFTQVENYPDVLPITPVDDTVVIFKPATIANFRSLTRDNVTVDVYDYLGFDDVISVAVDNQIVHLAADDISKFMASYNRFIKLGSAEKYIENMCGDLVFVGYIRHESLKLECSSVNGGIILSGKTPDITTVYDSLMLLLDDMP